MSTRIRILALTLLIALATLAPAAADARANTLCVGGGHCFATIQAAVNAADAGDTIRIGPGTFAGGITIDESVNLVGAGPRRTVIDGGGPVVTIGSATSTPTATISGLTLTGGVSDSDPQSPNCGPDLITCGPGYTTATALGGGIEAFPGTDVTIENDVVTDNRAVPSRTVTSVVATCSANTMCRTSDGDGGGIDDWGTMTVIDTQVTDNRATGINADGGGIVVERNASLSLQHSTVTGNRATSPGPDGRGGGGGGIFVDNNGSLVVDGTEIDGNSVDLSNSLVTPYPESQGTTDEENSFGGGVDLVGSATATISNSELDRNSVSINTPLGQAYGGDPALAAGGPLTLQNIRVKDNAESVHVFSSDANGVSGPSAFEADSNATITGVAVVGNHMTITTPTSDGAAVGAVGFFAGSVPATMSNSIVANNTATANAPKGMATVQGAGIVNDSDLIPHQRPRARQPRSGERPERVRTRWRHLEWLHLRRPDTDTRARSHRRRWEHRQRFARGHTPRWWDLHRRLAADPHRQPRRNNDPTSAPEPHADTLEAPDGRLLVGDRPTGRRHPCGRLCLPTVGARAQPLSHRVRTPTDRGLRRSSPAGRASRQTWDRGLRIRMIAFPRLIREPTTALVLPRLPTCATASAAEEASARQRGRECFAARAEVSKARAGLSQGCRIAPEASIVRVGRRAFPNGTRKRQQRPT